MAHFPFILVRSNDHLRSCNFVKIMTPPNGERCPDGRHLWVQEKEEIIRRLMHGLLQLLLICSVDGAKVRDTAIKWMRRGQEGNDERLNGEAWKKGRWGWKSHRNRYGQSRTESCDLYRSNDMDSFKQLQGVTIKNNFSNIFIIIFSPF